TLPLCLNGRAFEMCVWKFLMEIPYGETRSYGEIAAVCGNRKAARAVGQAVHRNPLPMIIPCHRVVGASNLGGYTGGLLIKRFLLRLERAHKENGEVFLVKNSKGCYSDRIGYFGN
ncbi:MAG: MGMT family protein, partial [Opitutales bacterium]|nr:MGMT family protein [Opitutales bacterium]